jgi:cell division protein FtsB
MGRWIAIAGSILLAAACGYIVAYLRFGAQPPRVQRVESQLDETKAELSTMRDEKRDLQQRLEQVTKEQERLAQENELLRQQQVTEALVSDRGGELPALPPK